MKKLRISMSSSLPDRAATVSIWINNVQIENVITIGTTWSKDYDLSGSNPYTLRIKMENDYTDSSEDLNLIINFLQLSDDNGVFTKYDYLATDTSVNYRLLDNSGVYLTTLWGTPNEFTMTIDADNPILWHDSNQEQLDNP